MAAQETYDVRESAAFLKIHPETVRGLIRTGELAAVKIGRRYVIRRSVLDAYLAAKENDAAQASLPSRSEKTCPSNKNPDRDSIKEAASGILTSASRAARVLDGLLAHKTSRKPKNSVPN
ncbi:helix-turn-helix domain-containing protein [Neisseria bacilliformis]|uniref:helix-turn-helix domain-containing protein n=1 Tax=Neisseria bacilliformis TaxID=267212 RepID=UPI0009E2D205|nr:helix-turn-helix domain-containing protein [Neisseria bacilliformis]